MSPTTARAIQLILWRPLNPGTESGKADWLAWFPQNSTPPPRSDIVLVCSQDTLLPFDPLGLLLFTPQDATTGHTYPLHSLPSKPPCPSSGLCSRSASMFHFHLLSSDHWTWQHFILLGLLSFPQAHSMSSTSAGWPRNQGPHNTRGLPAHRIQAAAWPPSRPGWSFASGAESCPSSCVLTYPGERQALAATMWPRRWKKGGLFKRILMDAWVH